MGLIGDSYHPVRITNGNPNVPGDFPIMDGLVCSVCYPEEAAKESEEKKAKAMKKAEEKKKKADKAAAAAKENADKDATKAKGKAGKAAANAGMVASRDVLRSSVEEVVTVTRMERRNLG
ncbi:hypothetical protein F4779DRAFT_620074 [Xylariaceae sp. FL0662B]|nr:hypothetical protein F4779DRAFT_620074 [Xylariaceae sp. FL0662B]